MKVQLNNVGIINECELEFVKGLNLIIGSSGSGKSTLLRSLYNIVTNSFSDSDISFGKTNMKVLVTDNDNIIEYGRSTNKKSDPCYFKVNGEKYEKVGRQVVPKVNETLRIGDVEINGENINFNFNLQFSTPFLIFGSQSTLYNVLTYRSSSDIASINDYYLEDIKTNESEVKSNNKLKEQLESNLKQMEDKEKSLSSIENIYANFIDYKHKIELIDILKRLRDFLILYNRLQKQLILVTSLLNIVIKSRENLECLINILKYKESKRDLDIISSKVRLYDNAINTCKKCIDLQTKRVELLNLSKYRKQYNILKDNHNIVKECINTCQSSLSRGLLLSDVLKTKELVCLMHKYCQINKLLSMVNSESLLKLEQLIPISNKAYQKESIDNMLMSIKNQSLSLEEKMHAFKVCPLCGNHLEHSHVE